jgi:MipA family protein
MNLTALRIRALATAAMVAPLSLEAQAKDMPQGWSFTVGAGMVYAPVYLGADSYALSALPNIRITYADKFFFSINDGVGYNVINQGGWRIGPIGRYDFGRSEDGDSPFRIAGEKTDDLRGLGDIDGTVELGGFLEYSFDRFTAKVELRQGVNGHEGFVGDAEVRYSQEITGLGRPIILSVGPNLKFAGSNYNGAYFGIDAGQSARSGLARYDAGAGVVSYGVGGAVIVPIRDAISMAVFAGYNRLASEAADSPLVKTRGSNNQAAIGISVGYAF